ncbi:hypothetical protein QOT17_014869 [Balamuthia mandrillaris]
MEGNNLFGLDENTLELVLCHLEPPDLVRVMCTCSALHKACNSKSLWLVLYLRTFGEDFWGENAGVHPYTPETLPSNEQVNEYKKVIGNKKVIPLRDSMEAWNNRWGECPPGHVLQRFSETYPPSHWNPSVPFDLRRFFSAEENSSSPGDEEERMTDNSMKKLFRTHLQMFRTWQEKRPGKLTTFVLAGLDQTNLDHVLTLIQKYCQFFASPTPPVCLDSPTGGGCSIFVHSFTDTLSYNHTKVSYRVIKVPKPRGWLRRVARQQKHVRLMYVVDGDEFLANDGHQKEVYREFHGILGESQSSKHTAVSLVVTGKRPEKDTISKVMNALRISRHTQPNHMCPYYVGPVVVAGCRASTESRSTRIEPMQNSITALSEASHPLLGSNPESFWDHPDLLQLFKRQPPMAGWHWLTRQPGRTPEWDLHPRAAFYHIGLLKDAWDESHAFPFKKEF